MTEHSSRGFIGNAIMASGIVLAAFIVSNAWKTTNIQQNQTISVTGSAKRSIVSDLAVLRGSITAYGTTNAEAFQNLKQQKISVLSYLSGKGFSEDKVRYSSVNFYPIFDILPNGMQSNTVRGYNCVQTIEVESQDVYKINQMSVDIGSIAEQGVSFTPDPTLYYYTKLANLKIEIQAEAAKDAKNRAERIAKATDRDLGPLRSARMGVIQITAKNSHEEINDYGINDVTSLEKEITAVVSGTFGVE
ncbi:MAG: SIMPL domain-containing protein [Candidatus Kapabacteria bacterium]|jgi:hypothetical protein|nr:SIMPL domain-containing protein [Candidatus Kapabacteria bacterium]